MEKCTLTNTKNWARSWVWLLAEKKIQVANKQLFSKCQTWGQSSEYKALPPVADKQQLRYKKYI